MRFQIKELREKRHLTQEELAEISGVSRATLSKLETNAVDVCQSKTLVKIAEALNVKVGSIFVE